VMNCREKYDVIFIDAYNDLSIPHHLTTREFAVLLRDIMNPGAILLTNIIDNFQRGLFLPSTIRTLREVFGEKNVHLVSISPNFEKTRAATFIVLTGRDAVKITDFETFLRGGTAGTAASAVVPENLVDEFVNKSDSMVLTDDHAPVDNLIAPVFETRFGYKKDR